MTEVGGDTQRLRHAPGTPEITVRWGGQSKLARRDESTTLVRVRELAHCNGRPSHWQDQHQRLLSACDSASRISCLFPNNGSHGAARVITPRKTDAVSPWLNHTERRNLKKKRKKIRVAHCNLERFQWPTYVTWTGERQIRAALATYLHIEPEKTKDAAAILFRQINTSVRPDSKTVCPGQQQITLPLTPFTVKLA